LSPSRSLRGIGTTGETMPRIQHFHSNPKQDFYALS
jgi:hypothetical protein